MNLLPHPRSLKRLPGFFVLPPRALVYLAPSLPRNIIAPFGQRLQSAAAFQLEFASSLSNPRPATIAVIQSEAAPPHPEGYALQITTSGIRIQYQHEGGIRAAGATLRQLLREYGRRLPCLQVQDYPDFPHRGVMLDVSRGRVPNRQTLLDLAGHLADFKINQLQLYMEHTFAYSGYAQVWRGWGPLTGQDIRKLDAHCRELGIELVPNQNSFGHLRYWLEYPPLKKLAEVATPYEGADGTFLRYPTTLAPNHPGTMPFLRGLYDELLPFFTSHRFNVGCDETWDLGRGQSKALCAQRGKGKVYLGFLKQVHREVTWRKHEMMFWGDIILHYPELIRDLPKNLIALDWGYEANHPFHSEAEVFARSTIPFYVCPGTSTWMTLIGRHDNAFANLRGAAEAGRKHHAIGYLNTDWGDGGHPQPLAVSYVPYLAGAALSWCGDTFQERLLGPVLSRDVFRDETGKAAQAALAFGFAHREFQYYQPNVTPFGAVIAAPTPQTREIPCREGLKYYARIPEVNIRAARQAVESHRTVLHRARPNGRLAEMLTRELDLAARMAEQSCEVMLWQQKLASGQLTRARQLAKRGIRELADLERDFHAYWPLRNKGTPAKCSRFLRWRTDDYRRQILHFPPSIASATPSPNAAASE